FSARADSTGRAGRHSRIESPPMAREIVINSTKHESRIAVLDEGQVVELWVVRTRQRTIVGNIYKGRVTKVLPGMQSAFVNLGLDRDAFLYVSDVLDEFEEYANNSSLDLRPGGRRTGDRRAGVERHGRREGRAHLQPHHATGALSRIHADGQPHR